MRSASAAAFLCAVVLATPAVVAHEPDTAPDHTFELSFGGSQLFDIEPLEVGSKEAIPTTSAVFIYEYFLPWDLHAVTVFNLPLSTFKEIRTDGSIRERHASPSMAAGLAWSGLGFALKEDVRVELQMGLLGGVVLASDGRYFPLGTVRASIRRRDGFGLYVGVAGAFRVDTTALVYGVGHRF